jgi:hypothetical protein
MRGRWLRLWCWLIASAVLGCAPAPSPTPALTPPPVPVDVVPWPDIVWSTADGVTGGQADDADGGEMVAAVVAGAEGFVAVGYRENDGVRDGLIWFSGDGVSWMSVEPRGALDAVEMVDVAQSPEGFVALGIGSLGAAAERPLAVFLRSRDGRSWDRLGPVPGSADTYPAWLAGDADGVVAAGTDADGAPAVWRSPDGRSFERAAINAPADLSVIDPQATDDGYLALGGSGGPPVLLRSPDGVRWTGTQIDVAADVHAARLIPGKWGLVVQGAWAPTCAASASCPASAIGWWSLDGSRWGRLPGDGSPISNGGSIVVPAGVHGLLAIDGASAWASADGWAWRALPEPGDGSMLINDAVVLGNVIVAVGAVYSEDGISRGSIVVAR